MCFRKAAHQLKEHGLRLWKLKKGGKAGRNRREEKFLQLRSLSNFFPNDANSFAVAQGMNLAGKQMELVEKFNWFNFSSQSCRRKLRFVYFLAPLRVLIHLICKHQTLRLNRSSGRKSFRGAFLVLWKSLKIFYPKDKFPEWIRFLWSKYLLKMCFVNHVSTRD